MNPQLRTAGLFVLLTGILVGIGYLAGYFLGNSMEFVILFLGFAIFVNLFAYFFSDRIVLWSYGARIVERHQYPRLFSIVEDAAHRANIPMPRVAVIPVQTPNAFATGRNPKNATVAVTEGILALLNDKELAGVIAHEVSHIKNRDILVMTIASVIAAAISIIARFVFYSMFYGGRKDREVSPLILAIAVVAAITLPIAAMLVQLAISRAREYKADATGARLIRNPMALADALRKLDKGVKRRPMTTGNPATSSLFIVNPFSASTIVNLLSTHPPIEKRIAKLEEMARKYEYL
ncbi:MAG: zinc metalloprotease HtpX [Thermoplasmata archaeon]|nr:zinc metalloprotease HtpX [Thermoplasmata archaeon]